MPKCGEVCEVYSRCCGFYRPVSGWNLGKKSEFADRKTFNLSKVKPETKTKEEHK